MDLLHDLWRSPWRQTILYGQIQQIPPDKEASDHTKQWGDFKPSVYWVAHPCANIAFLALGFGGGSGTHVRMLHDNPSWTAIWTKPEESSSRF